MNNLAGVNFENGHTVKGCLEYSSLPPSIQDNLICLVQWSLLIANLSVAGSSDRNKNVFRIKFTN